MISAINGYSQENIEYQKPPASILELVDVERAPLVSIDSKKEQMLFYYRDAFKSLSDLSQPELRLAGLRINPKTNIPNAEKAVNEMFSEQRLDPNVKITKDFFAFEKRIKSLKPSSEYDDDGSVEFAAKLLRSLSM